MISLVTGGTGFLGTHLIDRLLARGEQVWVLVRKESLDRFLTRADARWPEHGPQLMTVCGDLCLPGLGLKKDQLAQLKGVQRLYHLAALYDLNMTEEDAEAINIQGTREVLDLCDHLGCELHHVSSIAVSGGRHPGIFREDQFAEGQSLDHPYYRTKYESEAIVRGQQRVPFRIYRPAIVVGDSRTGEIDKADGPYFFFPILHLLRRLPQWLPLIGLSLGRMNLVPVNYVVDAIDALSHQEDLPYDTFHLVSKQNLKVFEVMNLFAQAAGSPRFTLLLPLKASQRVLSVQRWLMQRLPYGQVARDTFLEKTAIPESAFNVLQWQTRFDGSRAEEILEPLGIHCPEPAQYADILWQHWQQQRTKLSRPARRSRWTPRIDGKRILITGASGGIGRALALKLASRGATVLLVARSTDKLAALQENIQAAGGRAEIHPCDLTNQQSVDQLIHDLDKLPPVDVLVNNAGRSIRRSLNHSWDRFHDFERTMDINYFGALRITLGLLPRMRQQRQGHVIHVSSIGVPVRSPRFSAYLASKAAFDQFSRVAAGEMLQDNIHFSIIYMPLVRTSMITATDSYKHSPALTPETAADLIISTMKRRPSSVMTGFSRLVSVLHGMAPGLALKLVNLGYRFTRSSGASSA